MKRFKKLATQVLLSEAFRRSQKKAGNVAENPKDLLGLTQKVSSKANILTDSKLVNNLKILNRMLQAYIKGEYKIIPWATLVKITAAFIYFLSPLDFIPDLLPIVGFSDDIAIIWWVINSCSADIQRFTDWENSRLTVYPS